MELGAAGSLRSGIFALALAFRRRAVRRSTVCRAIDVCGTVCVAVTGRGANLDAKRYQL